MKSFELLYIIFFSLFLEKVFGYSELTCFDVFTIMTTAYHRREKDTLLYTFNDNGEELRPITYRKNEPFESIKKKLRDQVVCILEL